MFLKRLFLYLCLAALAGWLIVYVRRSGPQETSLPKDDSPYAELALTLADAAMEPDLGSAAVGFCLLDAGGHAVFEHHGGTAFIPASTLKTVTTATALEVWGPDHRLETVLTSTEPIRDGVIDGDLVIRGGGDPMLSLEDLEGWARTLADKGVKQITGRIVGDGNHFAGSVYDDFWNWGDIGNGYGSGVSGLNLEHNRCVVAFDAAEQIGQPAKLVGTEPFVPKVEWVNEVTTGAAGSGDQVVIHGGERTGNMFLRGSVPLGEKTFTVTAAIPNPPLYAAWHLKAALEQAGIAVAGSAEAGKVDETATQKGELLVRHLSPPLIEIITSIHATSDNHETECLFRLLGLAAGKASAQAVREHWQKRGLEFLGLRMEDGCGLARADFIRPLDLAELQHVAGYGPHGAAYRASLLTAAGGAVQWKAGAMSGVRCYTGFIKTASGKEFTFALMMNHFTDGKAVSKLRDELLAGLQRL